MNAQMDSQFDFQKFNKKAIENISQGVTKHGIHTLLEYPDTLNDPETPLRVVECYFLLRENELHTLYRVSEILSKAGFTAEEIGAACKIYMEN